MPSSGRTSRRPRSRGSSWSSPAPVAATCRPRCSSTPRTRRTCSTAWDGLAPLRAVGPGARPGADRPEHRRVDRRTAVGGDEGPRRGDVEVRAGARRGQRRLGLGPGQRAAAAGQAVRGARPAGVPQGHEQGDRDGVLERAAGGTRRAAARRPDRRRLPGHRVRRQQRPRVAVRAVPPEHEPAEHEPAQHDAAEHEPVAPEHHAAEHDPVTPCSCAGPRALLRPRLPHPHPHPPRRLPPSRSRARRRPPAPSRTRGTSSARRTSWAARARTPGTAPAW